jgi:predicted glycosyltransferase
VPPDIAPRFRHTGYVVEPLPEPLDAAPEVLVAVGGGDLGRGLLDAAAEAGAVSRLAWRLFVGGPDAEVHAARLAARHTAPGIAIEPVSAAYRARLPGALCSVSLTGYNTVAELARLPTPAVLVPDETGGEREQAIRAAALRGLPGVAVLTAAEATPARLGTEVARLAGTARPAFPVGIGGAGESARLLLSLARGEAAA